MPVSDEVPQDFLAVNADDSGNGTFNLAAFLLENEQKTETLKSEQPEPKLRLGGKRIDMEAQKYIVDDSEGDSEDDHVDVETISERGDCPVLEAGDVNSLLEQFEATSGMREKKGSESNVDVEDLKIEYNTVQFECVETNFEKSADVQFKSSDTILESAGVKFESVDKKFGCADVKVECADVKLDCVKPIVESVAVDNRSVSNDQKSVKTEMCTAPEVKKEIKVETGELIFVFKGFF